MEGGDCGHALLERVADRILLANFFERRGEDIRRGVSRDHTHAVEVRKNIDLLIGTWCIENRTALLHNDTDFRPMARHLGLVEVPLTK